MRHSFNHPSLPVPHAKTFAAVKQVNLHSWRLKGFVLGIVLSFASVCPQVQAAPPAPAPLTKLVTQLDAAANSRNTREVMEFYGPSFTQSDGLNRQALQESLSALWKRYPNLNYRTEIKSWKPEASGYTTETITYITGSQTEGDREFKLNSTLESRQRVENQKIVRQEILNERSEITSGANPPTLKINLPTEVRPGQDFSFDVIVQEPLGDDVLLGTALEEPVKTDGYLNVTTAKLEALPSGGIFKVGRAPLGATNQWLSAVVVRHDGITMVTQRMRVLGK